MKKCTQTFSGELRILHFAPERSLEPILRQALHDNYATADLRRKDVDLRTDITNLSIPDQTFDGVICSHVLEHIGRDGDAMRELLRVTKPGGWCVVQVPMNGGPETLEDPSVTDPRERRRLWGEPDHLRFYGDDIEQRLQNAGFVVRRVPCAELVPSSEDRLRFGLDPQEILFLCRT